MIQANCYIESGKWGESPVFKVYKTISNGNVRLLIKKDDHPFRVIRFKKTTGKTLKPSEL